jgi:hypothetical protein
MGITLKQKGCAFFILAGGNNLSRKRIPACSPLRSASAEQGAGTP